MAADRTSISGEGMSVGRVYARAFSTIAHNPVATLGLAFLLGAIPGLLISWFVQSTLASSIADGAPAVGLGLSFLMLLSYLVTLIFTALVQGALTRATVAESQGRRAGIGECLGAALPVALPLVALIILWALGIMAGAFLLLVPAVILACMWAVAIPAMVEERVGIIAAFSRSRALTRGDRWKVFGVLLILLVAYYLLLTVLGFAAVTSDVTQYAPGAPLPVGLLVVGAISGTLFSALWGTLAPSMYIDLRGAKEGGSLHDLEEVFS